jgi:hypothetical protein
MPRATVAAPTQNDLGLRNAAQAHGVGAFANLEALGLAAHRDEAADAQLLAAFVEHPGEDHMQLGDAAAGDPMLLAVEDVNIATPIGARRHLGRGAAGLGLGDADRRLVTRQDRFGREPFLGLAAVLHDRRDAAHVGLDDDPAGDAAGLGHLLHHQGRLQEPEALSAIVVRHGHAHEAGLGQVPHVVPGVVLALVHRRGTGGDLA